MSTITKDQAQKIIEAADEVITALAGTNEDVHPESDSMIRIWDDLNDRYAPPEVVRELARIVQASLDAEKGASLQLRNLIRQRHAEWSNKTFGDVGPVGPLKHLSKEALEAAAEPEDLSEWADMQFLLWDAQRRAGICDGEITAAMEEKLKVNMARQWPEPKDGEPRLHIKSPPAPVSVKDHQIRELVNELRDIAVEYHGTQQLRERIARTVRAAMLQGADGNSPVIPDGWVACSERMPDDDDFVYIWPRPDFGVELHVGQYCECHPKGDGWYAQVYEQNYGIEWCPITVTHWMPLPAAPKQEVNNDQ